MQRNKFISSLLALTVALSLVNPFTVAYGYDGNPPASYDLYAEGLATPAKSQGPWASCWAFGALSSIESNLVKKGYADDSVDLSERYLIWFATKPVDKELALKQPSALLDPQRHSQEGEGEYLLGDNTSDRFDLGQYDWVVASALSSGLALEGEAACPYQNNDGKLDKAVDQHGQPISIPSGDGDWSVSGNRAEDNIYRLKSAELIEGTSDYTVNEDTGELTFNGYREHTIDDVKRALFDNGAVTLNYAADVSEPNQPENLTSFNYDNWAQYRSEPALADHAVSIIGWDDSYPKEKFANASGQLPPKDGAWKVKNSWGRKNGGARNTSSWGVNDEGWFYLSYYDKGIESFLTYDIELLKDKPLDIMQYDFIGMNNYGLPPIMYEMNNSLFSGSLSTPRIANVFQAPYDLEISEVSYAPHIQNGQVDIKIYVQDEDAINPEDGLEVYSDTVDFKHAGYHTYKLKEPVVVGKGMTFSVVETLKGEYEGDKVVELPVEIGYDQSYLDELELSEDAPRAIYKAVVNPGESYCYVEDWIDNTNLATLEDFRIDGITYGNNLVKVFVEPTDKEIPDYEHQLKVKFIKDSALLVVFLIAVGASVYYAIQMLYARRDKKISKNK